MGSKYFCTMEILEGLFHTQKHIQHFLRGCGWGEGGAVSCLTVCLFVHQTLLKGSILKVNNLLPGGANSFLSE